MQFIPLYSPYASRGISPSHLSSKYQLWFSKFVRSCLVYRFFHFVQTISVDSFTRSVKHLSETNRSFYSILIRLDQAFKRSNASQSKSEIFVSMCISVSVQTKAKHCQNEHNKKDYAISLMLFDKILNS